MTAKAVIFLSDFANHRQLARTYVQVNYFTRLPAAVAGK